MNRTDAEQLFVQHLRAIERMIDSIARRRALRGDDRDDFSSWVMMRLIDNDYAIVRKFQGRSSITTYLAVVIANLYRDYRIKEWGRWRPSVAARRLGPVATRLETLVARDRLSLQEAFTMMEGPDTVRAELRRLAAQLPQRVRVMRAQPAELDMAPAAELTDAELWQAMSEQDRAATEDSLMRALQQLPDEDQLILRMHYWDGVTVADIARALHLEQKPLYRRITRALGTLRNILEQEGVEREQIAELLPVGA